MEIRAHYSAYETTLENMIEINHISLFEFNCL